MDQGDSDKVDKRLMMGAAHFARIDEKLVTHSEKLGEMKANIDKLFGEIRVVREKLIVITSIASFVAAFGGTLLGFFLNR